MTVRKIEHVQRGPNETCLLRIEIHEQIVLLCAHRADMTMVRVTTFAQTWIRQ